MFWKTGWINWFWTGQEPEVRSRVIDNFVKHRRGWEDNTANWSAVCGGNVGGALMYLEPEIFAQQLPRLLDIMRTFMSGFSDDGTCLEGFGYWHYGFGNFLWFADLLYQYTNGEYDLLTWDKVEAVAGYAQCSFLTGGTTISNADGTACGKADRAMISYLHRRFPQSVQQLPESHTHYLKGSVTWMQVLRNLLYADHSADNTQFHLQDVYLPSAQQAILHRKGYSLAAKAGHNHEPHNHNDVGSFILSTGKGQIFCDLGSGLYTRQYFRRETRYDIFCNSSRGHSVPIVNGAVQKYGDDFRGTLTQRGDRINIDFSDAYGQAAFRKLHRTFVCTDSRVVLTDSFAPDYEKLTERFVTAYKPQVFPDHVTVGGVKLSFDAKKMTLHISEEAHYLHDASLPPQTVYCIDFELAPGLSEACFTFDIPEE